MARDLRLRLTSRLLLCVAIGFAGKTARSDDASASDASIARYPAYRDGLWGYIDAAGEMVIEPRFEEANDFSDQRAVVNTNGEVQCIDPNGDVVWRLAVTELMYHHRKYSEGRLWYTVNDLWGCVDLDGNVVIPHQYGDADPFSEGAAVVAKVHPNPQYEWEYGDQGMVGLDGEIIFPIANVSMESFKHGLCAIRRTENSGVDFIDHAGEVHLARSELDNLVSEPDWYIVRSEIMGEERFSVRVCVFRSERESDEYHLMVDHDGQIVAGPFVNIGEFSEGLARVVYDDGGEFRTAFITPSGELTPLDGIVEGYHDGLCRLRVGDEWMYIDRSLEVTLRGDASAPWNEAEDFDGPLARVHIGGEMFDAEGPFGSWWTGGAWHYINRSGEVVAVCRPDIGSYDNYDFRRFGSEFSPNFD